MAETGFKNIGILGTGDVGRVLGAGLLKKGYNVMIGSRDTNNEKLQKWISENPSGKAGTFEETAKFGDLIIIATLWTGTENALKLAGPDNFKGKVVIDATNPLNFTPSGPELAVGHTNSGGEIVQSWLPGAHVVKAFNIVGNAHMIDPNFPGGPPDMWIAGNDSGAKGKITEFLKSLGWDVIDAGDITASRLLEPMCILWVKYGFMNKSWNHAFKLLKK